MPAVSRNGKTAAERLPRASLPRGAAGRSRKVTKRGASRGPPEGLLVFRDVPVVAAAFDVDRDQTRTGDTAVLGKPAAPLAGDRGAPPLHPGLVFPQWL